MATLVFISSQVLVTKLLRVLRMRDVENAESTEIAVNDVNNVNAVNSVNTKNISWREAKGHHLDLLFSQKLLYIWQILRRQHLLVVPPLVSYYGATLGWLVLTAWYKTKATVAHVFVRILL